MPKKVLGICGSLRAKSLNKAVLMKIGELLGDDVEFSVADIGTLPHYSEDLESPEVPDVVAAFKSQIESADAVVIVTPEYNYSVPGVLKNAIDWASRPGFNSVLKGKRIAIASASMAGTAGVRAQGHLKVILSGTLSEVIPSPEVAVAGAHKIVGEDGNITDEATLKYLGRLADSLVA